MAVLWRMPYRDARQLFPMRARVSKDTLELSPTSKRLAGLSHKAAGLSHRAAGLSHRAAGLARASLSAGGVWRGA